MSKDISRKFADDREAVEYLELLGFPVWFGIIYRIGNSFPTERAYAAIDYLCEEWDYVWKGEQIWVREFDVHNKR